MGIAVGLAAAFGFQLLQYGVGAVAVSNRSSIDDFPDALVGGSWRCMANTGCGDGRFLDGV